LSPDEDISVSSLWTPSGEHVPDEEPDRASGPDEADGAEPDEAVVAEPDEAVVAEELRRVRAELAATPVVDLIANHAVGLWQLAVLHLVPEGGEAPHLADAALAIDALAAIVEGLGDRLEGNAEPLRDALAQLRVAFVQVQERGGGDAAP
jgi:hypothetical protein